MRASRFGLAGALVLLSYAAYLGAGAKPEESRLKPSVPLHPDNGSAGTFTSVVAAAPIAASPLRVPSSELDDLIRRSKMSEGWLSSHGFASGSALRRLHALLDGHTELNAVRHHSLIMKPPEAMQAVEVVVTQMAPEERYVHASLAAGIAGGEDSVLVRWRRLSDDVVIELSSQALPANPDETLQFWMHRTQDWSPGSYRLEVISANPYLELLAAGEFDIASHGAPVTPFAFPLNPSMTAASHPESLSWQAGGSRASEDR